MLEQAHAAWERMAKIRDRRRRYVRYTYGDQWSDPAKDRHGLTVTEGELFSAGGRRPPLSNNLIRRMVKAVVGRYRMGEEGKDTSNTPDSAAVERWRGFNSLDEVDARTLEEFLISGMAVHRVWGERRPAGDGVWVDAVAPERFFINEVSDSRAVDTELIGQLCDMGMPELVMRFSRGDRGRAMRLRELYTAMDGELPLLASESLSSPGEAFFHGIPGKCRVIEVWTLESREALRCHDPLDATFAVAPLSHEPEIRRLNSRRRRMKLPLVETRWELATAWHCRMFAPDGTVLDEFDSPLRGGSHPFAVKLYPLVDGDVHSLVEDVIDQQRYVNRLITMMDTMMGTAAKGVLLFPTGCKPEGQSWQSVAEMWADPGGVLPYRPFQGTEPHQVVTPVSDFGAREMLATQISLFEDVSGVSSALMGKSVSGVVGVERYESEVRNASVAVDDLLKTFSNFTAMRNHLIASVPFSPSVHFF